MGAKYGGLTKIGALGCLLGLSFTSKTPQNLNMRYGLLAGFSFCTGASLAPLVGLAVAVAPSALVTAFLGTCAIFLTFSLSALTTQRRAYMYLGGYLGSAIMALLALRFGSYLFGGRSMVYGLELYGGLMIFSAYILYDTQLIVERASAGDMDHVSHALDLLVDLVAIFVRILIILLKRMKFALAITFLLLIVGVFAHQRVLRDESNSDRLLWNKRSHREKGERRHAPRMPLPVDKEAIKQAVNEVAEEAEQIVNKIFPVLEEADEAFSFPDVIPPKFDRPEPGDGKEEGGQLKIYNLSDRTVLVRTQIAGVIYADLALEQGLVGYLSCEFVWYTVEFFEANTNKMLCSTGSPVDVYCGNTVVLDGNGSNGYQC